MEETNVIKMEAPAVEPQKLSYEELENVAKELYNRCAEMATEIQKMKMDNSFKRLDYLFKTLKYYSLLDAEFVRNCAKEIQEMITIPEEVTEKEE
jgi:hypothetical protein